MLEEWFSVVLVAAGVGRLGWQRDVAGGPWGWLLGRWSAVRTALRCSAVGRRRGTHCALPGAKLRSNSRAELDVEVRLTAHRPPHGLRSSSPAKSPPPHPTRRTTWATGWCTDIFQCALGDKAAVCGYSAFTAAPARADLARREIAQNREGKMIDHTSLLMPILHSAHAVITLTAVMIASCFLSD